MSDFSFISNAHPQYIESIYEQYQQDPEAVDQSWRNFFRGFEYAQSNGNGNGQVKASTAPSSQSFLKEFGVQSIIHGYRNRGHLLSNTNPIRERRNRFPHLDLADYNLEESDLNKVFQAGEEIGLKNATLQQILGHLRKVYCGSIGFEYTHIDKKKQHMWLREKIEL